MGALPREVRSLLGGGLAQVAMVWNAFEFFDDVHDRCAGAILHISIWGVSSDGSPQRRSTFAFQRPLLLVGG